MMIGTLPVSRVYYAVLLITLLPCALYDIRKHRISNQFTLGVALYGCLSPLLTERTVLDSLFGMVVGGGTLLLITAVLQGGFGGGDIKLAAGLGLAFGAELTVVILMVSSVTGILIMVFMDKERRTNKIAFAPFLFLGCCVAVLMM